MALNSAVLSTAIQAQLATRPELANAGIDLSWMANAIAEAVVTHITTSAIVLIPSVSGVTTGSGVSGPGTGTIT